MDSTSRRIQVDFPALDSKVWLPTVEDVVIQKLRWGRPKDLTDVQDVLFVSGDTIDFSYVEDWCGEHGTLEFLRDYRAKLPLTEAGHPDHSQVDESPTSGHSQNLRTHLIRRAK